MHKHIVQVFSNWFGRSLTDSVTILAIDPGYDRVGWCVAQIHNAIPQIVSSGCIETDKKISIYDRYAKISKELEDIIEKFHPTECGIENLFFAKNVTSAMRVSEARGVIMTCLIHHGIAISEYTPQQIKVAVTGNGRATKFEMQRMVQLLTKCEKLPKLDDEVDAMAIALCHGVSRNLRRAITI